MVCGEVVCKRMHSLWEVFLGRPQFAYLTLPSMRKVLAFSGSSPDLEASKVPDTTPRIVYYVRASIGSFYYISIQVPFRFVVPTFAIGSKSHSEYA